MRPKGLKTDLAGLLDGELQDTQAVENINAAIEADETVRNEFNEQREIKSLLGEIDEYDAPSFMTTRIMGEISAKRNEQRRTSSWMQIASALGGLAVVVVCVVGLNTTLNNGGTNNAVNPVLAVADMDKLPFDYANLPTDGTEIDNIENDKLRNLLEYASDAHRRSELTHTAGSASPDLDGLIMMIDQNPGSN